MDGNSIFWLAAGAMVVVAFGFIARPLVASASKIMLLGVAIVVLVSATGLYLYLGTPQIGTEGQIPHDAIARDTGSPSLRTNDNVGSVASMVDGLAARLAEDPTDGDSWLLLARSYNHLNRTQDALDAFAKASALGRTDAELEALRGGESSASNVDAQIYGNVSLSPAAMEIIQPTDTIFIFAKAVDGPAMPAAVLRRSVTDLPLDFLLNDSQSMIEGVRLSDFDRVVVTARITRSGDAMSALQGLEAKSDPIAVADNRHLTLIIE